MISAVYLPLDNSVRAIDSAVSLFAIPRQRVDYSVCLVLLGGIFMSLCRPIICDHNFSIFMIAYGAVFFNFFSGRRAGPCRLFSPKPGHLRPLIFGPQAGSLGKPAVFLSEAL